LASGLGQLRRLIRFNKIKGEGGTVPLLLKLLLPAVAGALSATVAVVGLVYTQSQAPAQNPASQPVLVYGDQS
jgi:hypothetical protein